jgi:hypothetical protein
MYFDKILIEINDVRLEPLASGVFHVQSLVELEGLPSLPLLHDSVSLFDSVDPLIIGGAPTREVDLDHSGFFVDDFSVAPFSYRV